MINTGHFVLLHRLRIKLRLLRNMLTSTSFIMMHISNVMTSTKDKLTICAEVTGDKQALNNRLDRVQDLMTSLRDGEKKVEATHVQGEKTLPQTARQGQAHINGELESVSVTQDYETLATRLGETQQNLTHSIQALQAYDGSCIKDLELKFTLPEKQAQVEKYKALQNDVHTRQGQFDDLKNMASQDLIGKLRNHALEHETYQENFSECSEWLGTSLQRLQELVAEKDQGATRIHYTVECGEKLYPSTASEGPDIIHQELRGLREHWEQGCDVLSETQCKLDTTLLQWYSYDENFDQFRKWFLDTEIKLREDTDLKATLSDKKAQLQNHRLCRSYIKTLYLDNM
ncbi:SYNE1 [Mytilus coruscus]|uniref:SYNE1 n=1 Tax=Mytilus coruscus TaxID=42192 RepID=A0A6J8E707_MYTCO|nr:SYNE1 [Mytilus coruscus]